jgi:hypothetical protein
MGRSIRDEVLGEHLLRVRARREDLRRILSGGAALVVPTLQEKQGFQDDYARLGPVEAALAELLPRRFAGDARDRHIPGRIEAAVLNRVRERAAAAAVPLLVGDSLSETQQVALDRALGLFHYCGSELQRIAADAEALRQARLLEGRLPRPRPGADGVRRFIGVGGWALLIGGWW